MSATALQLLEDDVRELIRRRRLDPSRDDVAVRDLIGEVLDDYDDRSLVGGLVPLADRKETHRALLESVAGFGPLQPYLDDPSVEEIWINAPRGAGERRVMTNVQVNGGGPVMAGLAGEGL